MKPKPFIKKANRRTPLLKLQTKRVTDKKSGTILHGWLKPHVASDNIESVFIRKKAQKSKGERVFSSKDVLCAVDAVFDKAIFGKYPYYFYYNPTKIKAFFFKWKQEIVLPKLKSLGSLILEKDLLSILKELYVDNFENWLKGKTPYPNQIDRILFRLENIIFGDNVVYPDILSYYEPKFGK